MKNIIVSFLKENKAIVLFFTVIFFMAIIDFYEIRNLWGILAFVILLPTLLAGFYFASRMNFLKNFFGEKTNRRWFHFTSKSIGFYIGPFQMQILRIIFSVFAGLLGLFLITYSLKISLWFLSSFDLKLGLNDDGLIAWYVDIIIIMIISYHTWKSDDGDNLKIPFNHVGIITFFGNRYPIYLREGDYTWRGQKLKLGISTTPLAKTNDEGELKGYPLMGNRVLPIWNDVKSKSTVLSNLAKNDNYINLSATISIRTENPTRWMYSDDPIQQIAEQVRGSIRIAVNYFLDVDVSALKSAFPDLLTGKTVLVSFTVKAFGTNAINKVVRNKSGNALFRVVKEDEDLDQVIQEFRSDLEKNADSEFLDAATYKKSDGSSEVSISELKLTDSESLNKVIEDVGATLIKVAISNIDLSDVVKKAAEKAASEMLLRRSQLASVETYGQVSEALNKAGLDPKTATLVALKMDGVEGIEISHLSSDAEKGTSDSSDLLKAANLVANSLKK